MTATPLPRIYQEREIHGRRFTIREACAEDAPHILELFTKVYGGKYPLDFGTDPKVLEREIADSVHYLWAVAEVEDGRRHKHVGCMMTHVDPANRLGKSGGGAVLPEYRKGGLASTMLELEVDYLTRVDPVVDVIYGTSRAVSEGPMKMVAEAGFKQMGFFPNAVQIDSLEHLNLDVVLTDRALAARRRRPNLCAPFQRIYNVAAEQLGLEEPAHVTERVPPKAGKRLALKASQDAADVAARYRSYSEQSRISQSFFPFHFPNWSFATDDGGTEVFVWYGGVGKQAAIVGYRTDRVNTHDVLDAVARALDAAGAAYVELLVDAYDYNQQLGAYAARFLPSAYFPAMRLAADGQRDDYFVLSRTFRLLDFTGSVISPQNAKFLRAYLLCYYELYIEPIVGPAELIRRMATPG